MRSPRPWQLPTEPTLVTALYAQGVTRAMVRTQLARGQLIRVRPGVLLAAASWPDEPGARHLLTAEAEQVAYPSAVISHGSAAMMWGLPHPGFGSWADESAQVTFADGGRTRYTGAVHHLGPLPAAQVRQVAGHRVTSPARTAVDLAAGRTLPEALVLLDAAARMACTGYVAQPRRRDFVNPRLICAAREELTDCASVTRRVHLTEAIGLTEPARESPIESLSAGYFHLAGLPNPEFQAEIRTSGGFLYPDFLWREQRVIGEADGAGKYDGPEVTVAERQREQVLRDLGYRVVRWLGKEIMLTPWLVVDRVARKLEAA